MTHRNVRTSLFVAFLTAVALISCTGEGEIDPTAINAAATRVAAQSGGEGVLPTAPAAGFTGGPVTPRRQTYDLAEGDNAWQTQLITVAEWSGTGDATILAPALNAGATAVWFNSTDRDFQLTVDGSGPRRTPANMVYVNEVRGQLTITVRSQAAWTVRIGTTP